MLETANAIREWLGENSAVIAAGFSACAAWTMVRIQSHNLRESARPELIFYGWHCTRDPIGCRRLRLKSIRNVGKGAALNINVDCFTIASKDSLRKHLCGTYTIPTLASGESLDVELAFFLEADAIPVLGDAFQVVAYCEDVRGLNWRFRESASISDVFRNDGQCKPVGPNGIQLTRKPSEFIDDVSWFGRVRLRGPFIAIMIVAIPMAIVSKLVSHLKGFFK